MSGSFCFRIILGSLLTYFLLYIKKRLYRPVYTLVKVTELKEKRNESGLVTVLLTTFNEKEEVVFEGDLKF
ncbi:hypothetical protein FQU75_24390 [Paenibacillus polymyxa]|nr:hypothetical protein FQU75_24390 [Paenibacillus polymyxa]